MKEVVKFEVGDENILDKAVYGVAKLFLKNQEQQNRRWKEDVDNAILRTGERVRARYVNSELCTTLTFLRSAYSQEILGLP